MLEINAKNIWAELYFAGWNWNTYPWVSKCWKKPYIIFFEHPVDVKEYKICTRWSVWLRVCVFPIVEVRMCASTEYVTHTMSEYIKAGAMYALTHAPKLTSCTFYAYSVSYCSSRVSYCAAADLPAILRVVVRNFFHITTVLCISSTLDNSMYAILVTTTERNSMWREWPWRRPWGDKLLRCPLSFVCGMHAAHSICIFNAADIRRICDTFGMNHGTVETAVFFDIDTVGKGFDSQIFCNLYY